MMLIILSGTKKNLEYCDSYLEQNEYLPLYVQSYMIQNCDMLHANLVSNITSKIDCEPFFSP